MKTLIDTRIYALLSHNESNLLELTQAYKEFIEIMTEIIANCNDRDEILRILHYGRIEFDVLSHPMFNQYADNVLRTTFIYKVMYILDCEINIVSNSMKYASGHDYSSPFSCQDGELLWIGTQQETKEVRAGQNLTYILSVENTGELPLENIEISSVFSQDNIKAEWKQEEGFTANGMQGIISGLKAGEIRNLQMTVQLTEEQAGELIHTVTVKAKYPGKEESIGCQKSVETEVIALKAAFEVEKTADRTQAYPGDTITYQICIRNTGERTLHSVLSTERFQNAGIQANFVRKEGVTLNSTGTQALIPQIAPGEAFALYATVTVPQYMASQELINEVIVTSDETGTQAMTSKANVELKETDNIVTVTPQPASLASQSYGYDSKSGSAYTTASKPRTGDETETALYIVLGIFAIMSGVSAFCYRKTKKQQK